MNYREEYERWLVNTDEATVRELSAIDRDEDEIKARFFGVMPFGTAGQRGIMGAGLSRMNIYTIRYTTQALANLIKKEGAQACERGVVISYDCRNNSELFARTAAGVLAANGIKVMLFDDMRPTPLLSFAIRELGAISGINITASHNPKEYNGYKVYWSDGAQLPPKHAATVTEELVRLDIFRDCRSISCNEGEAKGLIVSVGRELDEKFIEKVLSASVRKNIFSESHLSVVYTPFHGTGRKLIPEVLKRAGVKELVCVEEQMLPDGNFSTLRSPNPEEPSGFRLAIEAAQKNGGKADILLASDPDADRLGIMVKHCGEYRLLTGNQIGALLLYYIITAKKETGVLSANSAAIKTIVTSELAKKICDRYNIYLADVYTGFKFIGEVMEDWADSGEKDFVFGYEESFGYLVGDYCRDKDAVGAALMLSEAAAFYKSRGMTLIDAMEEIYSIFGRHFEVTDNIMLPGLDGLEKTGKLMATLRSKIPQKLGCLSVLRMRDYKSGVITDLIRGEAQPTNMESSDVVYFELADGSSLAVRPSGTEPKVKVYYLLTGENEADCRNKYLTIKEDFDRYKEDLK